MAKKPAPAPRLGRDDQQQPESQPETEATREPEATKPEDEDEFEAGLGEVKLNEPAPPAAAEVKRPEVSAAARQPRATRRPPRPAPPEPIEGHTIMWFTTPLTVKRDRGAGEHKFKRGWNHVPDDLVDHWYVKASGAERAGA